jgi:hypothetical protein
LTYFNRNSVLLMMLFDPSKMLFLLAVFFATVLGQRPDNTSLCDYYAEALYGTNSNVTQFRLIQSIVGLAFAGPFNLPNASSDLTGIWNPGTFNGHSVNLRPWFNGSIASTNVDNQALAVNWLDDPAGLQPIEDFLSGSAPAITLGNSTNELYGISSVFYGECS